jgi:ABC-2 type transport system ATP-binding protein
MTSVLQVQSVTKCYGNLRAVDDLSLALQPGEFCVLLGLNGAGKTTLFQLLTGLFTADHGTIVVAGCDLRSQAAKALARLGRISTVDPGHGPEC